MIIKPSCFKKFPELIFDILYERNEYKHKISFTSTYSKEEYPISDNYLNIIHTGIIRWEIVFYKKHAHCAQNTIMPKIQRHHLYSAKTSIQLPRIKSSCNYNYTIIKESVAEHFIQSPIKSQQTRNMTNIKRSINLIYHYAKYNYFPHLYRKYNCSFILHPLLH